MCGRFTLGEPQAIPVRFDTANEDFNFDGSYNIAPGFITPVIVKQGDENIIEMMKWGLVPFWADNPNIGYKMINARSEEIENKPAYRVPVRKRRCLVPASGFYEWKTLNLEGKPEKYPWYYKLKDEDIFAFAGLYDIWKDAEGKELQTYTLITIDSNNLVGKVHPRMPVILDKDQEDKWISEDTDLQEALKLLKPIESEKMISRPVSRKVNSPGSEGKELIKEVERPENNKLF